MVRTFVKKPIKVQAIKWTGYNFADIREFIGIDNIKLFGSYNNPDLVICTLEGDFHASVGDWIVRGAKGEFYPVKSDIFDQTYEEVIN